MTRRRGYGRAQRMIDLTTIDQDTIIARGQYATVRAEHENQKKLLSVLCGQLSSASSQVLRFMQPGEDEMPALGAVNEMIDAARKTLGDIEACVATIEALALQRAALKPIAWPR